MMRNARFVRFAATAIALGSFAGLMGCDDYPQNEDPLTSSDIHKTGLDLYGGANSVTDNADVVKELAYSSRYAIPATDIPATTIPATTTYSTPQEAGGNVESGSNTTAPAAPVP
jgi:hypothetical protein